MNKGQRFFVWFGIMVLIFYGFVMLGDRNVPGSVNIPFDHYLFWSAMGLLTEFFMGSIVILVISCGFIIAFKDRKRKVEHK